MSTSASPLEASIQALEICEHCAGEHQGSCSVDKTLLALSTNLRNSFHGTSRWSLSDTTAGLFKVFNLHALNCAADTFVNGVEVNDRNEIEQMLEWMRWSHAAYENDEQTLATNLELDNKDLVKVITNSGINKPAFFIGIHHLRKCVVLAIRGTNQKQDVFTDLSTHNKQFLQGTAHSGMLGAAKWLFENESQTLQSLLVKNPGYRLVLTGHSLGAAIAGLLAMIIRATDGWFTPKEELGMASPRILCWGYGCAPCVDRILAESSNFICNVVLQDDIVARLTPAAVEALRNEIQSTSWSEVVQDERAKRVLETIGHIQGSILSTGAQAGAALFQTIDNLRTSYVHRLSASAVIMRQPAEETDSSSSGVADKPSPQGLIAESISTINAANANANKSNSNSNSSNASADAEPSDTGMAAQTVVAVATGSSIDMEELERRRLFVPGILVHVKRLRRPRDRRVSSLPTSPRGMWQQAREEAESSATNYVVVRGEDPAERFGRIVVSKTMISDHSCPRYIRALSVALSSCPGS